MDEERFDRLAIDWAGGVDRRGALRGAAGAAIAALLAAAPGLGPQEADAAKRSARFRCRRKHGVFVNSGECRCAARCSTSQTRFRCHDNPNCFCGETSAGEGFCAGIGLVNNNGCSPEAGAGCPTGFTCVVNRGCPGSGDSCTTRENCQAAEGCVNGRCQQTSCYSACPT